ncbi:MAG: hypothetical protein HQK56_09630 [Deltaproteobacteria bacterium]|nr:hypothetical protein [Deltaproteobacteria bacterium]
MRQLKSLALEIGYLLIFSISFFPLAIYWGTSSGSLLHYFLYVIIYDIIPGTLLYVLLSRTGLGQGRFGLAVVGWTLGLCLEVTTYNLLDPWGMTHYFQYYPVAAILCCGMAFYLRQGKADPQRNGAISFEPYFSLWFWFALAVSIIIVAVPMFKPIMDPHFAVQAAISNSITAGWPYNSPFVDGAPLYYHYLIHTHMAAAGTITGIPALELTSRITPFFLIILCLSSIYIFALNHYKSKWVGILVIVQAFWVVGVSPILYYWLGSAMPLRSVLLISTLAAFPIFFWLTSESFIFFEERKYIGSRLLIIILLAWTLSGTRLPGLTAFMAGLGLVVAWRYIRGRRILAQPVFILAITCVLLVTSLIHFYGILSPLSAVKFMKIVTNPAKSLPTFGSVNWLHGVLGLPLYLSGAIGVFIIIIFQASFLVGGALWLFFKRSFSSHYLDIFWLATLILGSFISYFTFAPGFSHFSFMDYGHLGLNFLGARGLLLFISAAKNSKWYQNIIVILITCSLLLLQSYNNIQNFILAGNLKFQNTKPVTAPGQEYQHLIDYLRRTHKSNYKYVVFGFDPSSLPAEIKDLYLLGSPNQIFYYLDRHSEPILKAHLAFIKAIEYKIGAGLINLSVFQSLKTTHRVSEHVKLIIFGGMITNLPPNAGEAFKAGNYAVFQLD